MLARREPDRVIQMARDPENDSWYEYKNPNFVVPDQGYLQRYLSALYRHRRLALAVTGLVLVLAVGYLLVATPIYEANVRVLIEPDTPNIISFKEVIEENASKLEYYQTQMEILRSRSLARKTIDKLDLWKDPEVAPAPGGLAQLIQGTRASASAATAAFNGVVARALGGTPPAPAAPPSRAATETATQSRVIDEFLSRLVLNYRADNRILEVGFRSANPQHAAAVANAVARNYMDDALEVKFKAANDASDWLNARIAEQRKVVEATETAVQRYREANGEVAMAGTNIVLQKLTDLNSAATKAKTERLETEALYRQLQDVRNNRAALDTLPVILADPFILKLKGQLADLQGEEVTMSLKLGDKHPDIVKLRSAIERVQMQLEGEVNKIAQSVGNQYRAALAKEQSLTAALDTQNRQALGLDRRAIQYNELQREATSNRQVFEALLQRAKETDIARDLKTSNIRIVDPAEPPLRPAYPAKIPVLLFAMVIGLPLGAGAAIGRELADDRVKLPDEIKNILGVKFLGFSPAVRNARFTAHGPVMNGTGEVPPLFSEAMRTVRANVFLSAASTPGTKILLVTSTGPNEGKTAVASTLAVTLAQSGRRVLLVDADLRLSKVHEVFDISLEPGFSNVLRGALSMRNAIRSTSIPGLAVVTAGPRPENPGDLLEAQTFQNAIAQVEDQFDWIVVDTPPVMAVSDTIAMVPASTGVVFVVGSQMTRRRAAEAALEQLDAAEAKILGAVLSRADVLEHAPYYHSSYLRYHGYHAAR